MSPYSLRCFALYQKYSTEKPGRIQEDYLRGREVFIAPKTNKANC
jgi:hypothetical protein